MHTLQKEQMADHGSLNQKQLSKFNVKLKVHKQAKTQKVPPNEVSTDIQPPYLGIIPTFFIVNWLPRLIGTLLETSLAWCVNWKLHYVFLTSAGFVTLYRSIYIEDGMASLQWFVAEYTSIPEKQQPNYCS